MNRRKSYVCSLCGCKTHTHDHVDSLDAFGTGELCAWCFTLLGDDNHWNDSGEQPLPRDFFRYLRYLREIDQRGGDHSRIVGACPYIWGRPKKPRARWNGGEWVAV